MKTNCIFKTLLLVSFLISCNTNQQTNEEKTAETSPKTIEKQSETKIENIQPYEIESAYIRFVSHAAGQELIREWYFDKYGQRQAEENYMMIMGEKSGDQSIILDGYQYQWQYNANEGTKRKFHHTITDYNQVSERDIQRYGIVKHGYENFLGKNCLKVTVEKPSKATIWVWNGIVLKTEATFGGQKVLTEALEIITANVDEKKFTLPDDVRFNQTDAESHQ